jgi:hypothetical protein
MKTDSALLLLTQELITSWGRTASGQVLMQSRGTNTTYNRIVDQVLANSQVWNGSGERATRHGCWAHNRRESYERVESPFRMSLRFRSVRIFKGGPAYFHSTLCGNGPNGQQLSQVSHEGST